MEIINSYNPPIAMIPIRMAKISPPVINTGMNMTSSMIALKILVFIMIPPNYNYYNTNSLFLQEKEKSSKKILELIKINLNVFVFF